MLKKRLSIVSVLLISLFVFVACNSGGEEPAASSSQAEPTAAPVEETAVEEAPTQQPVEETADSAPIRTFSVVSSESSASYVVSEEFFSQALEKLGIEAGLTEVIGSTTEVSGELTLNTDNPDLLDAATFTVNMASLETDQSRRDNWLKDNALQSGQFPEATFVATGTTGLTNDMANGSDVSFQLNGDLTVRDVTNSVTFDVTAVLNGDTISGVATLPLNMTDFGIEPPNFADTLTVADAFTIRVELTAREQ